MQRLKYNQAVDRVTEAMSKNGIFLTTSTSETNTMTIGWGTIGHIWGQPIFTVLVRKSRHTHPLIEEAGEFTVSVPPKNELEEELSFCGTRSGRDYNKFEECNLTALPGQEVETPVIGECNLHYECRIRFKQDMEPASLDPDYRESCYPRGDYHTIYYGEIVACYST